MIMIDLVYWIRLVRYPVKFAIIYGDVLARGNHFDQQQEKLEAINQAGVVFLKMFFVFVGIDSIDTCSIICIIVVVIVWVCM